MDPKWTKIQLEDETDCLIWMKSESNAGKFKYTCYLTDMTQIFREEGDLQNFETRFSELNDDMEVEDLRDVVNDLQLKLPLDDCKKIGRRVGGKIEVELDWEWDGGVGGEDGETYALRWRFKLSPGTIEQFSELVTKKLFLCLLKQQQDHDSLLEIIKKKDLEIEDYENCGASLSRSSLKTGKFKVENSIKDHIVGPAPKMLDYFAGTRFKELLKSSFVSNPSHEKDSNIADNSYTKTSTKDKKRKYDKPDLAALFKSNNVNAKKKQRLDKF